MLNWLARRRPLHWLVAGAMLLGLVWAQAQVAPEVTNGLRWLAEQVKADASVANEDKTAATPEQVRLETHETLTLLGRLSQGLRDWVGLPSDGNTEYLARQAVQLALAQRPDAGMLAQLSSRQNADGGFGGAAGYASHSLDTAFALLAYEKSSALTAEQVQAALDFLLARRNTDGGWGKRGVSNLYETSMVVLAASAVSRANNSAAVAASGRDWLLSKRSNGSYGSVLHDAMALLALARQTSDAAVLDPLAAALKAAQAPDGSWGQDPYLTSLALRALWFVGKGPTTTDALVIKGTVLDAVSKAPIGNAVIEVVENSTLNGASGSDGAFSLNSVPPGTYSLRISRLGYESRQMTVSGVAGEIVALGSVLLRQQSLTATLSGVIRTTTGTAIPDVIVSVGSASALTDATGAYQLSGLNPGAASVVVTKVNYLSSTASVTFEAGKSYVFSPALYQSNTPTSATLRGRITDSNGVAVAGAQVALGSFTRTSAADGRFEFTGQVAQPFALSVTATGYARLNATGTLVNGINDVGNLALQRLPATSTLVGKVLDAVSGSPLAGARVSVLGTPLTATADAAGAYSIPNVTTLTFTLSATATGYLPLSYAAKLDQPGNGSFDFRLTREHADAGLRLESVQTSKASYAPFDELKIELDVVNPGTQSSAGVVDAQVYDAQGRLVLELKANAKGLGQFPINNPITLPSGASTQVGMEGFLIRQAGGNYTALVRLADGNGRIVDEQSVAFSVAEEPMINGGLLLSPPITQAGTNTPVSMKAEVGNIGNVPVPAGDLVLTVTAENVDGDGGAGAQASVKPLAAVSLLNAPRAMARDASGNLFVANASDGRIIKVTPSGESSVHFTVPSNKSPSITDIGIDATGTLWLSNNHNRVFRISPALVLTEVTISSLTTVSSLQPQVDGSLLAVGTHSTSGQARLVSRDAAGAETVLTSGGLNQPYGIAKLPNGELLVPNYGDGTLSRVQPATGLIHPVASGLGRPGAATVGPDGNYYVTDNSAASVIWKVTPAGERSTYASGIPSLGDLKFSPAGDLYVSSQSTNAIYRVPAGGGSATVFSRGVAERPEGMKFDASGNLHIASVDGTVRIVDPQGQVRSLASAVTVPRGLALLGTDDVLVASYSTGAIRRVTASGSTNLIQGLLNPWGVAVDGNVLYVTESGRPRIGRYNLDGSLIDSLSPAFDSPSGVRLDFDGGLLVKQSTNRWVKLVGEVSTPLGNATYEDLVAHPSGVGYVAVRSRDVFRLDAQGQETKVVTLSFAPYGVGVAASGAIVVGDYSGRRVVAIDPANGAQTPLATFTTYPQAVLTDRNGAIYVNFYTRIDRVEADGSLTTVTPTGWNEYMYGVVPGADGRLTVWTNYGRVHGLDPITKTVQTLSPSGSYPTAAVQTSASSFASIWSSANEVTAHTAGTGAVTQRVAGFSGVRDVAVLSSGVHFVDTSNRLYRWSPGSYPKRLAENFSSYYLAVRGTELFAASGVTIYAWDGTKTRTVTSVSSSGASLAGVAFDAQGRLALGDFNRSRVFVLNESLSAMARQFTGLSSPLGLAFDASGRLFVANSGGNSVARFASLADGASAELFAVLTSNPRYLDVDAGGKLHASASAQVFQIDVNGVPSVFANSPIAIEGIASTPAGMYAIDRGNSAVRVVRNGALDFVTAGIHTPSRVRLGSDGRVYVANRGNGTISVYAIGSQQSFASGLLSPNAMEQLADGRWMVSGTSGSAYIVGTDGQATALNIDKLIGPSSSGWGMAALGEPNVYAMLYDQTPTPALFRLQLQQASTAPTPGTVVHQVSRPIGGLPVDPEFLNVDFGQWTPTYGGDYKLEITMGGVPGAVLNYLHVGPHARGILSVARTEVPPGDQLVPMTLQLTGADFTSVSRVEAALVKPLVANERPYGMVGDKSGAVWYTNGSALKRTLPNGTTETVIGSLSPAFGLAVDADERFYLPNRVSGRFHLMRVLKDGSSSLVADLGVTSAAGVAVNSRNEVLVGSPGKLLKVDPQSGAVSVVTTAGISSPRGIAIDALDNVYVQNEGHVVTMLRPDGTARVIYDRADGVNDPVFEGDGYPNITADCSENFYIAPSVWSKINQNGEEHTLAQVTARTGRVSTVFDGLKISSKLGDIDYLSFDRFSNRVLMWVDYVNEIWQAPVTCGAIGVEAHVLTKPGQVLAGFTRAPNAQAVLPDGRTEYVWSLRDVGASGVSMNFDTTLAGLGLGETRDAVDSAFLQFRNSFSPDDIRLPIDVPKVRVGNLVSLVETIDKPRYLPGETAIIGVALTNPNAAPIGGDVTVEVRDALGQGVGRVIQQGVSLLPNEVLHLGSNYAVEGQAPGAYQSVAELRSNGQLVARATVAFEIGTDAGGQAAAAALALDKASYAPSESVRITSRVINSSANQVAEGLQLRLRVLSSTDNVVFERVVPVGQLLPSKTVEFLTPHALNGAAPGTYRVEQVLLDAAQSAIDRDVASFEVQSTQGTGAGLSGTLSAAPREVPVGEPAALGWSVSNAGNAPLAGLPLRIRVIDPSPSAVVLATLDHATDVPVGQSTSGAQSWTPTSAQVGKTLLAVLEAQVSGQWLPLAQDSFSVKAAAVTVQAVAEARREARVLALVSCPAGSDGGAQGQPVAGGEATCAAQRAAGFSQSLASLGIVHKAVTSRAEFESELRCGAYNTYWISGGSAKLSDEVAREVAEAVRRGDALVLDGESDTRDVALLHSLAGVTRQAKLGTADQAITFGGTTEFPAGTLATLGWPTKYVAQPTAQVQATFADGSAALVTQRHGQGRSVVLAFELARMLKQSPADAAQQALVQRVLEVAAGAAQQVPVGAPVAVALKLSNTGQQAATVQVQAQLPAGLKPLEVNQALSWQVPLAAGQEHVLVLRLQAAEAGTQALEFTVTAGGQGNTVTHQVQVQALQQLAEQASAQVQALNPPAAEEQAARARALQAITQAQALGQQQKHDEALGQWLQAVVELQRIGGDTQTAALAVAQALQGAERALCPQLACLSGAVQIRAGTQPASQLAVNAAATLQRQVANSCQAALPEWQITAQLTNRRTAQTLLQLQGNVSLPAGQGNEQQGSFTAAGQSGDTLEALLYGQRLGLQQYLGKTTVVLTAPLVCDVDVSGAVNTTDLELIRQAIGKSVPAGDARDADGNKLITINDVRACTAKCTKPNCAL